jgi:hypothetical protein
MEERRNVYETVIREPHGKARCRYNIKINIREIGCEAVKCLRLKAGSSDRLLLTW